MYYLSDCHRELGMGQASGTSKTQDSAGSDCGGFVALKAALSRSKRKASVSVPDSVENSNIQFAEG